MRKIVTAMNIEQLSPSDASIAMALFTGVSSTKLTAAEADLADTTERLVQ